MGTTLFRNGTRHGVAVAGRRTRIAGHRSDAAGITGVGVATAVTAAAGAKVAVAAFQRAEQAVEELRDVVLGFLGGAKNRTIFTGTVAGIIATDVATTHIATTNRTTNRFACGKRSGTNGFARGNTRNRFTRSDTGNRLTRSAGDDRITGAASVQRTRFGFQKILQTGKQVAFVVAARIARITGIDIVATAIVRVSDSAHHQTQCKRNNQKLGLHRTNSPFFHIHRFQPQNVFPRLETKLTS